MKRKIVRPEKHISYVIHVLNDSFFDIFIPYVEIIYEKNDCIQLIAFYKTCIIVNFKKGEHLTFIEKLFIYHVNDEFKNEIDIQPTKKLKTKHVDALHVMERLNVIEQIKQKENHVIIFTGIKYVQKEVVSFALKVILNNMKGHSKERGHDFDIDKAKSKLVHAFSEIKENFACGCGRKNCAEIMQLYGPNGISPDKENDSIPYSDDLQKISFVVKSHNTRIKPGIVAKPRTDARKWYKVLARSMKNCTKKRIDRLRLKPKQTNLDIQQINIYDNDERNKERSNEHYVEILKRKRLEQKDICASPWCNKVMYFGNSEGLLDLTNVANKVSPNRRNNDNVFYEYDNFDLVCCSCNFTENRNGRTYVENKPQNNPIPFTLELLGKCKDWLLL
jgi:hypothetical protein